MAEILDWNYNSYTGAVVHIPSPQSAIIRSMGIGWHGPFKSKEETLAYYAANKDANPGWKAPTGILGNIGNAAVSGGDIVTGGAVSNVTDQLGKLNLGGWFVRISEILLGMVLIGVGIARLTGVQNVVSKVAKVAIPG
jgi:hypothetical protein